MKYNDGVKTIANSNRSITERGNVTIKEICQLIEQIVDYNYATEHYKGDGTVIEDKKNSVKNSLTLVMSDLDIYTEQLGLTDKVRDKMEARINKIVNRL